MRRKILKRMAVLLLCALLCIGMMGAAYAEDTPAPDFTIQISLPSDWASTTTAVKFSITDKNGTGFASAKAKTDQDSDWQDVTNTLEQWDNRHVGQISISENCTVYVSVTDNDGRSHTESRYIECFDHTAPMVRARISGQLLRIEASDSQSGVTEITAGGKKYTNLSSGKLDLPLKDFTSEQISVQAMDAAGNKSQTVQVENTAGQTASEPPVQVQKPVTTTPVTTTPVKTTTTPATAPYTPPASQETPTPSTTTPVSTSKDTGNTTTKPLTPDGQGAVVDEATNEDGKEFFTIATQDENTFYLVIDKQRDSDNVYFLDTVKESDLLSLAEKDKETEGDVSAIPDPEPVCTCTDKCVPGEVKTDCPVCVLSLKDCTGKAPAVDPDGDTGDQEPEKPEKGSDNTLILVVIAALAVGGVGYYLKIYKPKHDLDSADDFDDLTGGDEEEETINEDEEEPAPKRDPFGEPDEPEYQDGYYDEPGEDA